jgi:hypothetical protein
VNHRIFDEWHRGGTLQSWTAHARGSPRLFARYCSDQNHPRAQEWTGWPAREDLARAERHRDTGLVTDADVLAFVVHVADLQQRAIQSEGDTRFALFFLMEAVTGITVIHLGWMRRHRLLSDLAR